MVVSAPGPQSSAVVINDAEETLAHVSVVGCERAFLGTILSSHASVMSKQTWVLEHERPLHLPVLPVGKRCTHRVGTRGVLHHVVNGVRARVATTSGRRLTAIECVSKVGAFVLWWRIADQVLSSSVHTESGVLASQFQLWNARKSLE